MEVTKATREFKYNGVALQDPGSQYTLEQVREFYATLYPEIVNAAIEGPEVVGSKTVYEFRRAVGTKGAATRGLREKLGSLIRGSGPLRNPLSFPFDLDAHQDLAKLVQRAADPPAGQAIATPAELLVPLP